MGTTPQETKEKYMIGNDTFINFDGDLFAIWKYTNFKAEMMTQRHDLIYLDHGMLNEMFSWLRTHFKLNPTCPVCGHLLVNRRNRYAVKLRIGGAELTEHVTAPSLEEAKQNVISGHTAAVEIIDAHIIGVVIDEKSADLVGPR